MSLDKEFHFESALCAHLATNDPKMSLTPFPAVTPFPAGLYRELLRALIPLPPRVGEGLREQLERWSAEHAAERE